MVMREEIDSLLILKYISETNSAGKVVQKYQRIIYSTGTKDLKATRAADKRYLFSCISDKANLYSQVAY